MSFVDTDVLIPGIYAGCVAICVTLAIERFGGLFGGILGSLPSTIVPATYGLWTTSLVDGTAAKFQDTLAMVPCGMLLDAGFLYLWKILPAKLPSTWSLASQFAAMVACTLSVWFIGAIAFVFAVEASKDSGVSAVAWGVGSLMVLVVVGIAACLEGTPAPKGATTTPLKTLALRGIVTAISIGSCVYIGKSGAKLAAGVAAAFPAIFLTTMGGLWLSHGDAVPSGAVGPLMLGSSSVAAFALISGRLVPLVGAVQGLALSWILAVGFTSLPITIWLRSLSMKKIGAAGVGYGRAAVDAEEADALELREEDDE